MTRHYDLEEVIGWNGLRAMREAVNNAPEIPVTEDLHISVEIRLQSETFPGKAESGRSRSRLIGQGSCIYRGAKPEGEQ